MVVRNGGLTFERTGLYLKWWACVGNDGVVVRNDWLVFERVGLWFEMASSHSKGWGCV